MNIFLERFTLPLLVVLAGGVIWNPVRLNGVQRVSLGVAIISFGIFVSYTLYLRTHTEVQKEPTIGGEKNIDSPLSAPAQPTQKAPPPLPTVRPKQAQPSPKGETESAEAKKPLEMAEPTTTITGPATTNGPNSVANTGTIGTINMNVPPKEETKQ